MKKIVRTHLNDESLQKKSRRKKNDNQGAHEVALIDTKEYVDKIVRIYEMLKQGIRSNEIFAVFLQEDPELGETAFLKMLKHAYEHAENELHKDRDYIFELHMSRYEDIFAKCRHMVDSWQRPLNPKKDWHVIVAKNASALKALKSKEELIGLHDKSIVLELNENKAVVVEKETLTGKIGNYDIEKLSMEEAKELLALIKEARTVPIEGVHRVIIKTTKIEITEGNNRQVVQDIKNIDNVETHDVEYEEMPAEVVSKFKNITPKKTKEYHPDDDAGPKIINANEIKEEGKGIKDVTDSVNSSVLEEFKKKLRKSKGN